MVWCNISNILPFFFFCLFFSAVFNLKTFFSYYLWRYPSLLSAWAFLFFEDRLSCDGFIAAPIAKMIISYRHKTFRLQIHLLTWTFKQAGTCFFRFCVQINVETRDNHLLLFNIWHFWSHIWYRHVNVHERCKVSNQCYHCEEEEGNNMNLLITLYTGISLHPVCHKTKQCLTLGIKYFGHIWPSHIKVEKPE